MQRLIIMSSMLVALPLMIYSIYDSNREEVRINNEIQFKDGFTLGVKNLSDSILYTSHLNTLDTNISLSKFQLVPVSEVVKITDQTPDSQFLKIKWTIERDHKLPNLHYECWVSQLIITQHEEK